MSIEASSAEAAAESERPVWVADLIDLYSRELQIESNGEGEGWTAQAESYLFGRVFESPDEAAVLYEALLAPDTDPAVRLKAVEQGLDGLWKMDRVVARGLSFHLLLDPDEALSVAARTTIDKYW